jgi:hypothetical protein
MTEMIAAEVPRYLHKEASTPGCGSSMIAADPCMQLPSLANFPGEG